jgi:hypothetical protein
MKTCRSRISAQPRLEFYEWEDCLIWKNLSQIRFKVKRIGSTTQDLVLISNGPGQPTQADTTTVGDFGPLKQL